MRSVDASPETTLFIDDSLRNCFAAKELGMQTLLVFNVFTNDACANGERCVGSSHAL